MHTLGQLIDQIKPLDQDAMKQAKHRTDGLLKPLGSLGRLEDIVTQLAGIYRTPELKTGRKQIIVMAADHGVFDEGIAVTPKNVTAIQAFNMTRGTYNTVARRNTVCALPHSHGIVDHITLADDLIIAFVLAGIVLSFYLGTRLDTIVHCNRQ